MDGLVECLHCAGPYAQCFIVIIVSFSPHGSPVFFNVLITIYSQMFESRFILQSINGGNRKTNHLKVLKMCYVKFSTFDSDIC